MCIRDSLSTGHAYQSLPIARNKRATPDMRENIREVVNILRGACQLVTQRDMQFDAIAFRGDGSLRHPHWQNLLTSSVFRQADRFSVYVKIAGMGGGELSVRTLAKGH